MNSRVSIIGPLVLMLIGALFLVQNIRPDLNVAQLVAQYWPWVLIGWGVIRLGEIVMWYSRGQVLPRAGLSGGEWVFVVFLCLLGSGISTGQRFMTRFPTTSRNWGWDLMGERFDFPVNGSFDAAGVTRVVVENLRGDARIVGSDDAKIKVTGRKVVRAYDRSTAERADKATDLRFERQGEILYIRTSQEKWTGDEQISHEVDLTVPKGAILECKGRRGDFDITDVKNAVTIVSDNAGVRLQNIAGKVDIQVRRSDIVRAVGIKGDVKLKGSGENLEFDGIEGQVDADFSYTGRLEFKNLAKPLRFESNSIDMTVAKLPGSLRITRGEIEGDKFEGPARIKSTSKDVRLSEFSGPVEIQIDRGDIELTPSRLQMGAIDARTRSGEIEVSLPAKGAFSLSATTERGDVENEFGGPLTPSSAGSRGARLSGSTGAGPQVTLNTGRGKILVRKNGALVAQSQ